MKKPNVKHVICSPAAGAVIALFAGVIISCNFVSVGYIALDAGSIDAGLQAQTKKESAIAIDDHVVPVKKTGVEHILLFIGDGMNLEHEIAASRYLYGSNNSLVFHSFAYKGYVTTWSVTSYNTNAGGLGAAAYNPSSFDPSIGYNPELGGNMPYPLASAAVQDNYFLSSPATDSAAAVTAIMTGVKTDDGNICWLASDPEDGAIETIAQKLRAQRGFAIGVISTAPFNHATPAGVMAHNTSRFDYSKSLSDFLGPGGKTSLAEEIIRQAKPEVVIGGGHKNWVSGYITESLYNELKNSNEYIFVERSEGADGGARLREAASRAVSQGKKLWGLFGGVSGDLESPIPSDSPGKPGFLINPENPTLAQSVTSALEVLSSDPDGFFVLFEQGNIDTANHTNDYAKMIGCMNDLNNAVAAAVEFVRRPDDNVTWDNTVLIVTSDHGNSYMRLNDKKILPRGDLPRQRPRLLASLAGGRFSYPDGEVTYGTANHTSELVMIYAMGSGLDLLSALEGKQYLGTRIIDNTNIFDFIKTLSDVK